MISHSLRCVGVQDFPRQRLLTSPLVLQEQAPVSGGVLQFGAQNCHCGFVLQVEIAKLGDGRRGNQRRISGEHNHVVVACKRTACGNDRMPGATLWFLNDELHTCVLNRRADSLGLISNDGENILWRDHLLGRRDYVSQQRLPADLFRLWDV